MNSQNNGNNRSCDRRVRAYRNGKTFDECRHVAEQKNLEFQKTIATSGKILWAEILERVDHDELVYKLSLKYLRRDGFDIGNYKVPEVKPVDTI